MPIPPRFETVEDAGEFLRNHDSITAIMTPWQYARFAAFLFEWSDGGTSLPVLAIEFYRMEIRMFDSAVDNLER